jgi:hypothetical protein
MARTILRDRSGELVRSVQLADRTGIVAASAPQPVRSRSDEEMSVLDLAAVSGQLDVVLATGANEAAVAGTEERQLLRRVRRNLTVAGAAVVLLVVGWIGGDTFDFEGGSDSTPAVAVGTVPNPVPVAPAQPAPSSTGTPQTPATSPKSVSAPVTTKAPQPTRKKTEATTAPTSQGGEARTDTIEETPPRQDKSGPSLDEQLQQLIESWSWARSDRSGDFDEEQDRLIRSFGPFGE